jgi:hypothetical protein
MRDETDIDGVGPTTMTAMARRRQREMLPGLLAAVRGRRRRRRLARSALVLVLAGGLALLEPWRALGGPEAPPHAVPTAAWTSFGDDPTVLERCAVPSSARPEWFVDDQGLQSLLAAADRHAGLVRAGGQVFVDRTAIDRWDAESP